MLAGTLQEVWAALHAAHGGRVVMHLAAPDLADTRRSPDVPEMLQWRASHRTVFQRHLLQQRTGPHTSLLWSPAHTYLPLTPPQAREPAARNSCVSPPQLCSAVSF